MLVMNRRTGESVFAEFNGETLEVQVVEVRGNRVTLGLSGPRDIKLRRGPSIKEMEAGSHPATGKAKS